MINTTAEVLHRDKVDDAEIQKLPHAKVEQMQHSKGSEEKDGNVALKKVKSPKGGKRILPDAPMFLKAGKDNISRSSNDLLAIDEDKNSTASIMSKYKYNSLPRKKKDKLQQRTMSTSKFYIDTDSNLTPEKTPSNSQNSSPIPGRKKISIQSTTSSGSNDNNNNNSNVEKQTHVALYKFYPRHKDELAFCDGDPIQVLKCFDDLWYEGVNLSTGKHGVFPCRYVADILANDIAMCKLTVVVFVPRVDDTKGQKFAIRVFSIV